MLHIAMQQHNELLTMLFYLISYNLYDGDNGDGCDIKSGLKDLVNKLVKKEEGESSNDNK
jgi:hypothetical protein